MLNDLPILYAVRYPESAQWIVDQDESFVRGIAATRGAEVVTLDVPALLRVMKAADAVRRSVPVPGFVLATAARLSGATLPVEAAALADLAAALEILSAEEPAP